MATSFLPTNSIFYEICLFGAHWHCTSWIRSHQCEPHRTCAGKDQVSLSYGCAKHKNASLHRDPECIPGSIPPLIWSHRWFAGSTERTFYPAPANVQPNTVQSASVILIAMHKHRNNHLEADNRRKLFANDLNKENFRFKGCIRGTTQ